MIRSNLCDYSDAHIHLKVPNTVTVPNTVAAAPINNASKKVIFKNWAPFINCIIEINNTQVIINNEINNAQILILILLPMYNLIEYIECLFEDIRKFMAILYR